VCFRYISITGRPSGDSETDRALALPAMVAEGEQETVGSARDSGVGLDDGTETEQAALPALRASLTSLGFVVLLLDLHRPPLDSTQIMSAIMRGVVTKAGVMSKTATVTVSRMVPHPKTRKVCVLSS
jgi:hypothetical protein